jgi:hypothetical protein
MAPGHLFEIVRLARLTAVGARELRSPRGTDPQIQLMRLGLGIELLIDQFPQRLQA